MTSSRQWRTIAPLPAVATLLLMPGLAIHWGLLPFEYRIHALLLVSLLCIALCFLAGFSFAELGLGRPSFREHWLFCGGVTVMLALIMVAQTRLFSVVHQPPAWL